MAQYKLMYFDVMGRAELARMCFAQAGVEFTDDRFSFEEWPAKKECKFLYASNFYICF